MTNSGVYRITCLFTGKSYVGSSVNLRKRLRDHRSALQHNDHISIHLQRSWKKYGAGNFEFAVIEHCEQDQLLVREQYWLDKIGTLNMCPTAGSRLGTKQPKAMGERYSRERTGVPKSAAHKRKIGLANRGKVRTPEMKECYRQASLVASNTPHRKQLSSCAAKKQWRTTNIGRKIARAAKKKWKDPVYREKMRLAVSASNKRRAG